LREKKVRDENDDLGTKRKIQGQKVQFIDKRLIKVQMSLNEKKFKN